MACQIGNPVTGTGNSQAAEVWDVTGADLGIPWDDGTGRLLIAYGDTNEVNGGGSTDGTLAMVTDFNPNGGLVFSGMVTGGNTSSGPAIAAIAPSFENHCIPTAGTSIDGADFIHFMSLASFACTGNGYWTAGSGLAWRTSGTNSQFTVIDPNSPPWGPTSNFGQVAMMTRGEYVYLFGTPPGRAGGVKLARARDSLGAYYNAWEYWDGTTWQTSEEAAAFIVPPPVSELSVQFDHDTAFGGGRYLMSYLDLSRNAGVSAPGAIVLRDAADLEGPWTEEKQMTTNLEYNTEYGGYMYPFTVDGQPFGTGTGVDLYFNMSQWTPAPNTFYGTEFFHSTLEWRSQNDNVLTDGGFEEQYIGVTSNCQPPTAGHVGLYAPWSSAGDRAIGFDECVSNVPHSGDNSAWINTSDANSHYMTQTVAVQPNADYLLSFWVDNWNVGTGQAGLRTHGAPIPTPGEYPCQYTMCCGVIEDPSDPHAWLGSTTFTGTSGGYHQVSVTINTGPHSLVDVILGLVGTGSSSVARFDDVSLTPRQVVRDGGFEMQPSSTVSWPYSTEGAGAKGIDLEEGDAHTGVSDGWINTADAGEWNAFTQAVTVTPNEPCLLKVWVQTSAPFGAGYFGIRDANNHVIYEVTFGAETSYTELEVITASPTSAAKMYVGYWTPSPSKPTWMRIDDMSLEEL